MSTSKELQVLERLFRNLSQDKAQSVSPEGINDLFVRIQPESGEVSLYGEDDELIASTVIFSWVDKGDTVSEAMRQSLRDVVAKLHHEGYWEQELFQKPFSIALVDEQFVSVEELLFVDDEVLQLTTPLLSNLDEELGQFIKDLLQD